MTSEEPYGREGLTQNDLVEGLANPSHPAPLMVVFEGFLGTSLREGYRRLYLTDALDYCIEFKQDDEEAKVSIPKGESGLGLDFTKVWIKPEATIELIVSTRSSEASDILAILYEARGHGHRARRRHGHRAH